ALCRIPNHHATALRSAPIRFIARPFAPGSNLMNVATVELSGADIDDLNARVGDHLDANELAEVIALGESLVLRGVAAPRTLLHLAVAHTQNGSLRVAAAHLRHALQIADGDRDAAVIAEGCHWASTELMPRIAAED
ncbi:MAG: hypothetical protein AAF658_14930, partial [Myxococcota bacterium]